MSYQILGRTIKNEYLALTVFGTTFGGAYLATRGGSKAQTKPTTVQEAKETVPVNAGSSEEEKFILDFIRQAEKDESSAAASH